MNNQKFYGSLCLTEIIEAAKDRHPAFVKGNNGKIYFNAIAWLNAEPDQYKNVMSIQLQTPKDSQLPKTYVGNFKKSDPGTQPVSNSDISAISNIVDDLPF